MILIFPKLIYRFNENIVKFELSNNSKFYEEIQRNYHIQNN